MVKFQIIFSKQAQKDKKLLVKSNLETITKELLDLMMDDPFVFPPKYEKLRGQLEGCYSRRINKQHRLVYMVNIKKKEIYILRMWTHYNI